MEVKQGSAASITCSVSNFRQSGVTVTWEDSPGTATETIDSNGAHVSVLSLKNVQADSVQTCVVKSVEFPDSESEYTTRVKTYRKLLTFILILSRLDS